jgi:hypothetical protein
MFGRNFYSGSLERHPRPVRLACACAFSLAFTIAAGCAGRAASVSPPASTAAAATAAPAPTSGLVTHVLPPAELDPAADKYLAPQFAYFDPRAPRAPHLVVYLVGANNKPDRGKTMGEFLAGLGFPVIVPGYANDYDIRALCMPADTPDPDCHGKLRLEALEGKDFSPHIQIAPPNSLETRIVRMLTALAQRQPEGGWGAYLDGDKPRWEQITIAGHSHGASSAGIIGKVRRVHRVVMLSGPFDNRAGQPAQWTRLAPATPADRVFGFSHAQEEQYAGHIKDWEAMGLPPLGPVAIVESAAPPFGGSHQLVTALPPAPGGGAHGTTAAGKASPLRPDGKYVFEPVWRYLFGL